MPTTPRTYRELNKAAEVAAQLNLATIPLNEERIRTAIRVLFGCVYVVAQKVQDDAGGPGSHDGIDLVVGTINTILDSFTT